MVVVVPAAVAVAGRCSSSLVEGEQVALDGDAEVAGAQQDGEHPALEGILEKDIVTLLTICVTKNNLI